MKALWGLNNFQGPMIFKSSMPLKTDISCLSLNFELCHQSCTSLHIEEEKLSRRDVKHTLKSWKRSHHRRQMRDRYRMWKIYVRWPPQVHHSERLCFRSNESKGVTDTASMTALFIWGHKGERLDGIHREKGQSILSCKAIIICHMIHRVDIDEWRHFLCCNNSTYSWVISLCKWQYSYN